MESTWPTLDNQYFLTGNFVADISQFAGQTIDLSFRTIAVTLTGGPYDIDAITISVPEPSTFALALAGVLALTGMAMRQRRHG
jgi:hypothetical protein